MMRKHRPNLLIDGKLLELPFGCKVIDAFGRVYVVTGITGWYKDHVGFADPAPVGMVRVEDNSRVCWVGKI